MARATLSQRLALFIEAEMAGKTDKGELAKALKAEAKKLEGAKPASTSNDRPPETPPAQAAQDLPKAGDDKAGEAKAPK